MLFGLENIMLWYMQIYSLTEKDEFVHKGTFWAYLKRKKKVVYV